MNARKRQPTRVNLGHGVGHRGRRVKFDDLRLYPESFKLRHYLFPSVPHDAISKYVKRKYDPAKMQRGGHGWRARLV